MSRRQRTRRSEDGIHVLAPRETGRSILRQSIRRMNTCYSALQHALRKRHERQRRGNVGRLVVVISVPAVSATDTNTSQEDPLDGVDGPGKRLRKRQKHLDAAVKHARCRLQPRRALREREAKGDPGPRRPSPGTTTPSFTLCTR